MDIRFYTPSPALKPHIQHIMIFRVQWQSDALLPVNPFPPVPQHSLMFYLRDPLQSNLLPGEPFKEVPVCMAVGPQLNRVNIKMGKDHFLVHVPLTPGGLFRLTGIPMNELIDKETDLSLVWNRDITLLIDQLRNAKSNTTLVSIIETFLLNKLKRIIVPEPFSYALSQLIKTDGKMRIEQVASEACLSTKQFERKCKEQIGLPPKLFARLIRFSKAYRLKEASPALSWTKICYEAGYFDQMHMIRDFKEFAGVTPGIINQELKATPYRLQSPIII
ncbi:MAG: helix-turn-helix domain-containing protein [Chitinophagaceae bacterium]